MYIAHGTRLSAFKGKAPFIPDELNRAHTRNEEREKRNPSDLFVFGYCLSLLCKFVGLDSDQINTSACAFRAKFVVSSLVNHELFIFIRFPV